MKTMPLRALVRELKALLKSRGYDGDSTFCVRLYHKDGAIIELPVFNLDTDGVVGNLAFEAEFPL
jgi:hypothetical protein